MPDDDPHRDDQKRDQCEDLKYDQNEGNTFSGGFHALVGFTREQPPDCAIAKHHTTGKKRRNRKDGKENSSHHPNFLMDAMISP
jgi:hypothetical protein